MSRYGMATLIQLFEAVTEPKEKVLVPVLLLVIASLVWGIRVARRSPGPS